MLCVRSCSMLWHILGTGTVWQYILFCYLSCVCNHLTNIPLGAYFVPDTGQGLGAYNNTTVILLIMSLLCSVPKLAREINLLVNTSQERQFHIWNFFSKGMQLIRGEADLNHGLLYSEAHCSFRYHIPPLRDQILDLPCLWGADTHYFVPALFTLAFPALRSSFSMYVNSVICVGWMTEHETGHSLWICYAPP